MESHEASSVLQSCIAMQSATNTERRGTCTDLYCLLKKGLLQTIREAIKEAHLMKEWTLHIIFLSVLLFRGVTILG